MLRSRLPNQPELHNEFKTSLGYITRLSPTKITHKHTSLPGCIKCPPRKGQKLNYNKPYLHALLPKQRGQHILPQSVMRK